MIHAIGDSFTYGDELPSQDLAWPSLLSKKLGKKVVNLGRNAAGNTRIVKRVIDAVIQGSELIIIGFTDSNRVEFADEIGIYDIWAGRDFRAMQSDDHTHRINLIKYLTAYDTPEYYYVNWLRQVILLQNLCKAKNIPVVMFIACGVNNYHREYCNNHIKLIRAIDQSLFVDNDMFVASTDWTYGTPQGINGHPLEQGHEIIANKIYEHIRDKCRIS